MRSSSSRSCLSKSGSSPEPFAVARVKLGHQRSGILLQELAAADGVDRGVVRHPEQPPRRVIGNALIRPYLESTQHGFLHALLSQVQTRRPQHPRQVRDHTSGLVPEQMFQQAAGVADSLSRAHEYNWRNSMVP